MAVDVSNATLSLGDIDWVSTVIGVPGIRDLINIGKAVGIAVLIYIVFLIIRSIVSINYSLRFKKLTNNVEEINKKMDALIGKLGKKK